MEFIYLKLKIQQSLFTRILNFLYYLVKTFSYYEYKKVITLKEVLFIYKNKKYTSEDIKNIVLYDDGLFLTGIKQYIPYEYIVSLNQHNNITSMTVLGKVENDLLNICDDRFKIFFNTNVYSLSNIIINNIYYHMEYNRINKEVLSFKSVKIKQL